MDATCAIQDSIHVFSLVHKYVSRILGTYHTWLALADFLLYAIIPRNRGRHLKNTTEKCFRLITPQIQPGSPSGTFRYPDL